MASVHDFAEVQRLTQVQARTLRSWIRAGLLPKPIGRGRGARYTDDHVQRIRLIQSLRTQRVPLRQIRARLAPLQPAEIAAMIPPAPRPTVDGLPPPPPPVSYPSFTYEVVELMPGLFLMVQANKGESLRRIANEIYRYYGPAPSS